MTLQQRLEQATSIVMNWWRDAQRNAFSQRGDVFARASWRTICISENYYYEVKRARTRDVEESAPPTGTVTVAVPYDGDAHFGQAAADDVRWRTNRAGGASDTATIGHLAFANASNARIETAFPRATRFGTDALELPISGLELPTAESLRNDTRECLIRRSYQPSSPAIKPLAVDVEVIETEIGDYRGIFFRLRVRADLPRVHGTRPARPLVHEMSLQWPAVVPADPTVVVLKKLERQDEAAAKREKYSRVPARYDPSTRSLCWRGGSLHELRADEMDLDASRATADGTVERPERFAADYLLYVEYPAQLAHSRILKGTVEVVLPGRLLSDLRIQAYDARGNRVDALPSVETHLTATLQFDAGVAMQERRRTMRQMLHVVGVRPSGERIPDIEYILRDHGYRMGQSPIELEGGGCHLCVTKGQGAARIDVDVTLSGSSSRVTRETEVHGGRTVTAEVETGESFIQLEGRLAGDHSRLAQELNGIHLALRERFDALADSN